jgi:hypothetical protein
MALGELGPLEKLELELATARHGHVREAGRDDNRHENFFECSWKGLLAQFSPQPH